MSATTRVAIIDAHPMFRVGIAQLLRSAGGCEIVGDGAGIEDLFRLARQQAPDVIVVDLHLAFCPDGLRRFADEFPATRLLMLAVIADEEYVLAALQSGAAGYLRKGACGSELIRAVHQVRRGGQYVDCSIAVRLLQGPFAGKTGPDPSAILTGREQQILDLLTRGLTNKQIGRELALSERTIGDATTALLDKLEVRSRLHAALHRQS
jgi:two-component system, NarL family, nitrate/nitrite response regulator NarL